MKFQDEIQKRKENHQLMTKAKKVNFSQNEHFKYKIGINLFLVFVLTMAVNILDVQLPFVIVGILGLFILFLDYKNYCKNKMLLWLQSKYLEEFDLEIKSWETLNKLSSEIEKWLKEVDSGIYTAYLSSYNNNTLLIVSYEFGASAVAKKTKELEDNIIQNNPEISFSLLLCPTVIDSKELNKNISFNLSDCCLAYDKQQGFVKI